MFHNTKFVAAIVAAHCCLAPAMRADSFSVGGPVSAVVFDSRTQSIRLVTGVPGASLLGATLADQVDAAEIAPDGNAALALRGGQWYTVTGLSGASPAWTPLSPAPQSVDRIVWNADSSAAAVYSSATRSLTVVSNSFQISIGLDSLPGELTALALERSGSSAIVGIAGDAGGLYLVTPQASPSLLARLNRPSAVYLIQDKDLLAADADTLQVFEIRDYHGAVEWLPFANLPAGASKPVGLAMSTDGQFVFAADQACRCVPLYQFSTHTALDPLALDTDPAFLKPISLGRQFLMNSPADGNTPFWILSAGGDSPSIYFVSGGVQ
jgi:hypothetical protein